LLPEDFLGDRENGNNKIEDGKGKIRRWLKRKGG
jgi:hypothetical protein